MPEPILHRLTRHFTNLIGRKVTFAQATGASDQKTSSVYGVYKLVSSGGAVVVKADLALLGSFAGALVGLPDSEVKRHLASMPIEELLRDAMYEVLNIASAVVVVEERAVLTAMVTDAFYVQGEAAKILKSPSDKVEFNVTVDGYQGGRLVLLT